jgi:hypothetical protein
LRELDRQLLDELLKEEAVFPKVKLEVLIFTHLGLRGCSQVTIPAELPGGAEMGQKIDERVQPHLMKLPTVTEPRDRLMAVRVLKEMMEKGFEELVEESEPYKALYRWTDRLGLKSQQSKVRPTVHEIYVFKDGSARRELADLLRDRDKLRQAAVRKPDLKGGSVRFAYPEEFDRRWIRRMGRLLGYPPCCVDRYAEDRVNGVNVETRASNQLAEAIKAGQQINSLAYPLSYFFPCRPDCPASTALGSAWRRRLEELDPQLSAVYGELVRLNTHMVLKQPEIIQRYVSQFQPPKEEEK